MHSDFRIEVISVLSTLRDRLGSQQQCPCGHQELMHCVLCVVQVRPLGRQRRREHITEKPEPHGQGGPRRGWPRAQPARCLPPLQAAPLALSSGWQHAHCVCQGLCPHPLASPEGPTPSMSHFPPRHSACPPHCDGYPASVLHLRSPPLLLASRHNPGQPCILFAQWPPALPSL